MNEFETPLGDAFQQHKDWCNECRGSYGKTETGLCIIGDRLWRESFPEAERIIREMFGKKESDS